MVPAAVSRQGAIIMLVYSERVYHKSPISGNTQIIVIMASNAFTHIMLFT